MNDEEYATFLGGGDAAYEQMWSERHPEEPDEAFVIPPGQFLVPEIIYDTPTDPWGEWGDLPKLPPLEVIAPRILPYVGSAIAGLLALVFPQPMGPRELDEAAPWWELPPARAKPPKQPQPVVEPYEPRIDPELPGIEVTPRRVDRPPLQRPVLPIGDYPGMLADPSGFPEFPFPDLDPFFAPRELPAPDRFAPLPSRPPTPVEFPDPWTLDVPQPDIQDYPDVLAPPRTVAPPRVDVPPDDLVPDIGDPFAPYAPPVFDPGIYAPPQYSPFDLSVPLDMLQPDPFAFGPPVEADTCDCGGAEKKKKKKKKPQPRTVCYEGKYVEYSKGLTKNRLREIPCRDKKESRLSKTLGKIRRAKKRKNPIPGLSQLVPFHF
jgi:hypothetical protein